MGFLERMRQKPQHVKSRYAFLIALSATFCVALVWSTALPARFSALTEVPEKTDSGQENSETPSFADLVNTAKLQLGSAVESRHNITEEDQLTTEITSTTPAEHSASSSLSTGTSSVESGAVEFNREEDQTEETLPKPRTILIGTTTSHKTE